MDHVVRRFWRVSTLIILGFTPAVAAWGMSVVPPSFSELVNGSDYVVHAIVAAVTSEWVGEQAQRHIVTHVRLDVKEVVVGSPPIPLVLEMLGGKVGQEEMVIQGLPLFKVGDEDILFVRGNGRQFYPLTAASHGRYQVVRGAGGKAYVARSNHAPLRNVDEVALPLSEHAHVAALAASKTPALSPEQLVASVRSIRAKSEPAKP